MTESGNVYILTFRDYTTRYTLLYPLPRKNVDSIRVALRDVYSNFGHCQVLITDNAQEYQSESLKQFLDNNGTRKEFIAPYPVSYTH